MAGLGALALDDKGYRITDTGWLLCQSPLENIAGELGLQAETFRDACPSRSPRAFGSLVREHD